ncbi:MAG TPA: peptidogalycan biosysnthesis protein [Kofleriaceae bacterium]|nr:peptidogalycan biosysnthesis protein [Kofleriaceae bacterium]
MVRSIADVAPGAWDALDHGGSPFLRHGFLSALEETGSIGGGSGWQPRYLVIGGERGAPIAGAVAAFVKDHSYGEFIFDWEWARASERAGLRYYPKLVIAAPVTPATGPRLLLPPGAPPDQRRRAAAALVSGARRLAADEGCSGIHVLFCTGEEQALLAELGLAPRASFQFHWHNRGYRDFADFLAAMSSRRRKQARKERERARAAVDSIDLVLARELPPAELATMDRLYRRNVDAHWGTAYLEPGFFERLVERMPASVLVARARAGGRMVAGALFLEGERGLYGRYWGAEVDIPNLHFEMCVWLPIERCIERGAPLYEAGAQGGHKLLRGLEPSPTYSAHLLFHPALDRAVRRALEEEALAVEHHMRRIAAVGPFKASEEST